MLDNVSLLLLARIARQMRVAYENGGLASGFLWYFSAFSAKSFGQIGTIKNNKNFIEGLRAQTFFIREDILTANSRDK